MPPKAAKKVAKKKKKSHHGLLVTEREPPSLVAGNLLFDRRIIWNTVRPHIFIKQLSKDLFYPVINLLQFNISTIEPLCVLLKIHENSNTIKAMLDKAIFWLENTTSLVAVDQNNKVYGALIGRIINSEEMNEQMQQIRAIKEEMWKAFLLKKYTEKLAEEEEAGKLTAQLDSAPSAVSTGIGSSKKEILNYKIERPLDIYPADPGLSSENPDPPIYVFDDSYEEFDDDTLRCFLHFRYKLFNSWKVLSIFDAKCYYKIYIWCVDSEFQKQGIGKQLLQAAETMCIKLEIPIMLTIVTSVTSRVIANELGYFAAAKYSYNNITNAEMEGEENAQLVIKLLNVPKLTTYLPKANTILYHIDKIEPKKENKRDKSKKKK